MSDRSFRLSPLRLALISELVRDLAYECGSGDWPMQEADVTIRKAVERIRSHYGDADAPARDALEEHIQERVRAERVRVLAEFDPLFSHLHAWHSSVRRKLETARGTHEEWSLAKSYKALSEKLGGK